MTESQIVRNAMAESGIEMLPAEAEKLLLVHKELMDLSRVPIKTLRSMLDKSNKNSIAVYKTLLKIKNNNYDKAKKSD